MGYLYKNVSSLFWSLSGIEFYSAEEDASFENGVHILAGGPASYH